MIYFAKIVNGLMVEAVMCKQQDADKMRNYLDDSWIQMEQPN